MVLSPDPNFQSATPEPARQVMLAVLFADVVGSTSLYDTLGNTQAKGMVDDCIAAMRSVVGQYGGRVVKTLGDEVLCVLPSADKACLAAMDMQLRIMELPALSGVQREIRIGLHFGPVIEDEGDVFGDAVNLAARMVRLATAQQIITTRATVEQLSRALQCTTRRIATLSVKGKGEDVEVCEIVWQTGEDVTMTAPSIIVSKQTTLHLRHAGTDLTLDQPNALILVGRDAACQIVVADPRASRQHARIERRQNKFFLIDQSTNGTFVTFAGEIEITLRREELMLRGRGKITFRSGSAAAGDDAVESIEFLL
jgi:class 3 adenylate cyclase